MLLRERLGLYFQLSDLAKYCQRNTGTISITIKKATLSITTLDAYAECYNADHRYAECHNGIQNDGLIMPSAVLQGVVAF